MSLDRQLQLDLLRKIAESYPFSWQHNLNHQDKSYLTIAINLHYLKGHGLLNEASTIIRENLNNKNNGILLINTPKITEKGLDFLQDDGGLSAILNIVTVKFETDTLKAILSNHIHKSELPDEDKISMTKALEDLPAESIKHLTMKLLDEGIEHLPNALLLISSYLSMA